MQLFKRMLFFSNFLEINLLKNGCGVFSFYPTKYSLENRRIEKMCVLLYNGHDFV